jgi:hypothetical protein
LDQAQDAGEFPPADNLFLKVFHESILLAGLAIKIKNLLKVDSRWNFRGGGTKPFPQLSVMIH